MTPKTLIYYHRSYRKITGSAWRFILELATISTMIGLLIVRYSRLMTSQMSRFAQAVLSTAFSPATITVSEKSFLWGTVSIVSLPEIYPSAFCTLLNLVVSACLILFLLWVQRQKNFAIFFLFLAATNLVSAAHFLLLPDAFPYTTAEFSELYVKSQVSMWLFIPLILGMAFLPLPATLLAKLALISLTLFYSMVFGTLRYVAFLYIVSKFSVIYMALLYFAFGPLIDFVYIVGIYSYFLSRLAKHLKGSAAVWQWS